MNAVKIYEEAVRAADNNEITLGEFEKRIEPLKDVEAVVRCKDCKYDPSNNAYHQEELPYWYPCKNGMRDQDWFCADGKRR